MSIEGLRQEETAMDSPNAASVMNIALIEDEEASAKILKANLEKYGKNHDIRFEVKWFADAMVFLSSYKPQYDIVFMDIELPYLNGMSAAERLRKKDEDVCLIFVINLAQYAVNCLFHDLSFAADVVVDGVQKDHSVDRLQGTLLPFLGNGENLIRDPADGGI